MRRAPYAALVAILVVSCGTSERSVEPSGDWKRIAEGESPRGTFAVYRSDANDDESVCLSLELEPEQDLGPEPADPPTHLGRRFGCLPIPSEERPAEFLHVVTGGAYDVVLALTLGGSTSTLKTGAGEVGNVASEADASPASLYLGFPQGSADPLRLEVETGGRIRSCELPSASEPTYECN